MAGIAKIPEAQVANQSGDPSYHLETLPLQPATVPAVTVSGSTTLAGGGTPSLTITGLSAGQIIEIQSSGSPVVWRFRDANDSDGITNQSGAYPYQGKMPSGQYRFLTVPSGKTSIVLDYVTADNNVTVLVY